MQKTGRGGDDMRWWATVFSLPPRTSYSRSPWQLKDWTSNSCACLIYSVNHVLNVVVGFKIKLVIS